jgi:hypothetical protein
MCYWFCMDLTDLHIYYIVVYRQLLKYTHSSSVQNIQKGKRRRYILPPGSSQIFERKKKSSSIGYVYRDQLAGTCHWTSFSRMIYHCPFCTQKKCRMDLVGKTARWCPMKQDGEVHGHDRFWLVRRMGEIDGSKKKGMWVR